MFCICYHCLFSPRDITLNFPCNYNLFLLMLTFRIHGSKLYIPLCFISADENIYFKFQLHYIFILSKLNICGFPLMTFPSCRCVYFLHLTFFFAIDIQNICVNCLGVLCIFAVFILLDFSVYRFSCCCF